MLAIAVFDGHQDALPPDEARAPPATSPPVWLPFTSRGEGRHLWENPQTGHAEALPRCLEIAGDHRYFGSARIATQAGPLSVCCVTVFFMPPATATYGTPPIS